MAERTIAAIATALGEASIGVIRISGENAISIADKVFSAYSGKKLMELDGYSAAYGKIVDNEETIDDAVALVFKAPKSYTGENVVEISVHGGTLILRKVLRMLIANGADNAEAGEFTKRAFLNGKFDLTKAESIMGLISAKSEAQLKISRASHNGRLAKSIEKVQNDLLKTAASIAAYADYPDEDIEDLSPENFGKMLKDSGNSLKKVLDTFNAGKIIREGVDTVIVGKPNVGKSTLMNMLSGHERSIVTEIAGTTRDVIEDTVTLGDIVLNLADTAGIHETEDTVEKMGVERAKERIKTAGLVLAVFDCSKPLDKDDLELLESVTRENTVAVINKTDLGLIADMSAFDGIKTVNASAKEGKGYNELVEAVTEICKINNIDGDAAVLLNERQFNCVSRALSAVISADKALEMGCTVDAVGVCVDDALNSLLELTGKRVTNEVTDEIFRRFCVGK